MENPSIVALSQQSALRNRLAVIANNMANISTNGYKAERMMFVEHVGRALAANRGADKEAILVRDLATVRDTAPGPLTTTDNPLDVALQGEGYFVVATSRGERYTRNGHFRLDEKGQVVTADGDPVLTDAGTPFVLGVDDGEPTIAGDGTISTATGVIGRLWVVDFADPKTLRPEGNTLLTSDATPREVTSPHLVQGMIEGSNVAPILEIEHMIEVHRAYELAQKFITKEDDRMRRMMTVYAG